LGHPNPAPAPDSSGWRMLAEWKPHPSKWHTWPRPASNSFPGRYDIVPLILAKLVRLIAEGESVHINIWDADLERLDQSLSSGQALGILHECFPGRPVIGLDSTDLIWGAWLVPLPDPAETRGKITRQCPPSGVT
tara:strand:+ start:57 stop:461 length:405 start_codon:yes stop_codon:yes gene_type:complete